MRKPNRNHQMFAARTAVKTLAKRAKRKVKKWPPFSLKLKPADKSTAFADAIEIECTIGVNPKYRSAHQRRNGPTEDEWESARIARIQARNKERGKEAAQVNA